MMNVKGAKKMKKSKIRTVIKMSSFILSMVLLFAALTVPSMYNGEIDVSAASSDSKVQGYKDKINGLEADYKRIQEEIKKNNSSIKSLENEKRLLDEEIASLSAQVTAMNELIAEYDTEIQNTTTALETKQADIDKKFGYFQERMRVSYEDGQTGYLVMLFTSESIADFFISLERMTYMLEYDKNTMAQLNKEKEELQNEKNRLETLKAGQLEAKNSLVSKQNELQAKADKSANYLAQLQSKVSDEEKELKAIQARQNAIDRELQNYLRELEKQNQGILKGQLAWPVSTKTAFYNTISSKFGPRSYLLWGKWRSDFHLGVDIPVRSGSPIYASADGTVVKATYHPSYGYYVLINHGSGYSTLYAHNSALLVKAGQKVTQGQQISSSGSTGDSSGPHLHFEVRMNGAVTDPLACGALTKPANLQIWG